jgi:methylmalonyl-CoA/ethylmalonyl-CoA epimerase
MREIETMTITGIDHVGILSSTPEKVVEFYEKFLDFKVSSKRELSKQHLVVFDLVSDQERIEVIQPTSSDFRMGSGIKHVAFKSDDIEEDFRLMKEKGADLLHKQVQHSEEGRFFFMKSPSGEFVEIIQSDSPD